MIGWSALKDFEFQAVQKLVALKREKINYNVLRKNVICSKPHFGLIGTVRRCENEPLANE